MFCHEWLALFYLGDVDHIIEHQSGEQIMLSEYDKLSKFLPWNEMIHKFF